ncbi:MAG: hypothetical protein WA364_04810 [Candidatus Nitrosopolaris sp.]
MKDDICIDRIFQIFLIQSVFNAQFKKRTFLGSLPYWYVNAKTLDELEDAPSKCLARLNPPRGYFRWKKGTANKRGIPYELPKK